MKPLLAVLSLFLCWPAAAQSLEGAASGASFDRLSWPALKFSAAQAADEKNDRGGRPPRRRVGTLAGTLNGQPIELRWTEVHHRISGRVNGADVDVREDFAA